MKFKSAIFKKLLIFALIFILGVITGIVGISWIGKGLQAPVFFTALSYLSFELEEANNQYISSQNVDVGIYALEHLITFNEDLFKRYLESPETQKNTKVLKLFEKNLPFDLAITYVRLGNLYEKKGDKEKADQSFKKGLEIVITKNLFEKWKGTEKEIKTVEDLKRFVEGLDERLRKQKQGEF